MQKIVQVFCLVILFFFTSLSLQAANLDQIVAIVNDDIITGAELGKLVAPIYFQYKNTYQGEELAKQMDKVQVDALKQLIENKLIIQDAKKDEEIKVLQSEIDTEINSISARFPSRDDFTQALIQDKITLEDLENEIKDQLLIKKYLGKKLYSTMIVSPREIENYYSSFESEFQEKEKIKISHILIKNGEDREKAKVAMEEVMALLQAGGDFESLAKKYSQGPNASNGGTSDFFAKGYMLKEIEDAAFVLEVGKYSGIIETKLGYHIVKLSAKKKGNVTSLKEAWDEIENKLYQKKASDKYKELIVELKKNAYIQVMN